MDIIEIVSQGGLIGVGAVAVLLAYKYFMSIIESKKVSNPLNHCFFDKIKYERHIHLKNIKLKYKKKECPVRTKLFVDMLDIKFLNWKKYTKEFIVACLAKKPSSDELRSMSSASIQNIIEDYQENWKRIGVPQIVISKFNSWHSKRVLLLIEAISSICTSDSYSSLKEKLNAILEIHKVLIVITILDVEHTLGSLNGALSGENYGSKIIE